MCGFAALIASGAPEKHTRALAAAEAPLVSHGPDDRGELHRPPVYIIHRRLALVDGVNGRQPMSVDGDRYTICFAGEIFNHWSLRRELIGLGHVFISGSDTEVALRAWIQWGDECLRRFDGMFSLLFLDWLTRRALFARDQFGIKPAVFSNMGRRFAFSSSLVALRSLLPQYPQLDTGALCDYLLNQATVAPRTIYKGVEKLLPGHFVRVNLDNPDHYEVARWAGIEVPSHSQCTDSSILEAAIRRSLRARQPDDQGSAILLSGGLDSGVLAAIGAQLPGKRQAFCVHFPEIESSDPKRAVAVANASGLDLHFVGLRDSDMDALDDLSDITGEPFGDDSLLPTFMLAQEVKRHRFHVAISGDGADELFAGYDLFKRWLASCDRGDSGLDAWARVSNKYFDLTQLAGAMNPQFSPQLVSPNVHEGRTFSSNRDVGHLSVARLVRLTHTLPDIMLRKMDAAFMFHSIETRPPYLSSEVARIALKCDDSSLLRLIDGGVVEKAILVSIWQRCLSAIPPPAKIGFNCPLFAWAAIERSNFRRRIDRLKSSSELRMIFHSGKIAAFVDLLLSQGRVKALWILMALDAWLALRKFS
ncbi:asparagine synthase (glutamine-hydrolyzing) [Achromobacter arsenitoxydans]|nr:asparagine synthase (glutamine-hydrolyzing) [Achromobacter arsenitoxydans]